MKISSLSLSIKSTSVNHVMPQYGSEIESSSNRSRRTSIPILWRGSLGERVSSMQQRASLFSRVSWTINPRTGLTDEPRTAGVSFNILAMTPNVPGSITHTYSFLRVVSKDYRAETSAPTWTLARKWKSCWMRIFSCSFHPVLAPMPIQCTFFESARRKVHFLQPRRRRRDSSQSD